MSENKFLAPNCQLINNKPNIHVTNQQENNLLWINLTVMNIRMNVGITVAYKILDIRPT